MSVRRRAGISAAVALVPVAVALAFVRPVDAATQPVGRFGLTFAATAISLGGDVGAGGGLAMLDAAAPAVVGRLDSGPSAATSAAVVEPGTLARTGAGQVNGAAGTQMLDLPLATAASPGAGHGSYELAEPLVAGPVAVGTGHASARATPDEAEALGRIDGLVVSTTTDDGPLVRLGDARATGRASAAGGGSANLVAGSTTQINRIVVGGLLELTDVAGSAEVTLRDGERIATSSLTIASATVAGTQVIIDEHGIRVADEAATVPTTPIEVITEALRAAGIAVEVAAPTHSVAGRSAFADSGALRITVSTPPTPTVPGNSLSITLGRSTVTLSDDAAPEEPGESSAPGSLAPFGTDAVATEAPELRLPQPTPAPAPVQRQSARLAVAGIELPATIVIAAFGIWQLLSLSIATLAVIADRRMEASDAG